MRQTLLLFACVVVFATIGATHAREAHAYSNVEAAIDQTMPVYLADDFKAIAWRESGYDPYAVNPWSGACGPFQMLPYVAASLGYSCWDLANPWVAAVAAYRLYIQSVRVYGYGFKPWSTY